MAIPTVPITPIQSGGDSARQALVRPTSEAEERNARLGKGIFAGLANFAEAVKNQLDKNDRERDAIKSVEAESKGLLDADAKIAKLDPLASDYDARVQEIYEGMRVSTLAGADLKTPEARAALERRMIVIASAGRLTAAQTARGAIQGEAMRVRGEREDEVLAKIRKDPDGYDAYLKSFQADMGRLNQGIDPEKARKFAQEFGDKAIAARIEGLAERGNTGGALALLKNEAKGLTQDQYRALYGRIKAFESQQRADGERFAAQDAAKFEVEIIKGGKVDPKTGEVIPGTAAPTAADVQARQARGAYGLNPEKYVQHMRMIAMADAHRVEETRKDRDAVEAAKNRTIQNQEEADRAFRVFAGEEMAKRKPSPDAPVDASMLQLAERFAAEQGWVPSQISVRIANAERIGGPGADPEQAAQVMAQAAVMANSIQTAAPRAKLEIGPRVQAVISSAKVEGLTFDEAAKRVVSQSTFDDKTRKDRAEAFKELAKDESWTALVADTFGRSVTEAVLQNILPGARSTRVTPPPELAYEARRLAEENYKLVGGNDLAKVKDMTVAQLKRQFGVSAVGGVLQVVRFPPEAQLPPVIAQKAVEFGDPSLPTKIIEADIEATLAKYGRIKPANLPANVPWYKVAPVETTPDAIEAKRRNPNIQVPYALFVLDRTGHAWTPVVGWTPPTEAEARASEPFRTAEGLALGRSGRKALEREQFEKGREYVPARPLGMPPRKAQ